MMTTPKENLSRLIERFKNGDRQALAKLITMVESQAVHHQKEVSSLFKEILPPKNSIRIAVSGPPGVGKSTFINALGKKLLEKNVTLAILPIDPSSDISMGSILADKTRMKDLLAHEKVFIRPSPSKGTLGGIALSTENVTFVVESFGFDVVIIETVGVGQSETIARCLSDHFIVLMQPGSGDQLQAMKMGILEKADFIVINKADGEQKALAQRTKNSLKALELKHGIKRPALALVSALDDSGISEFLEMLWKRHEEKILSGELAIARQNNRRIFFDHLFEQTLAQRLKLWPPFIKRREQMMTDEQPLSEAVNQLVDEIFAQLNL